jgi:hypothetical protein
MLETVDARDVLDANARVKAELSAQVVGYFQRTGPNAWDDYQFVREDQGGLKVLPGIQIQLELDGTDFRMRKEGQVLRVRWTPDARDPAELADQSPAERRSYFIRTYLVDDNDAPGMGAAAWIAGKLGD